MNIARTTLGKDGRSELVLRSQSQDDEQFLIGLNPRPGEKLEWSRVDNLHVAIRVVEAEKITLPPPNEGDAMAGVDISAMTLEDLQTLAAQMGLKIEKDDRKNEILRKIRAARKG